MLGFTRYTTSTLRSTAMLAYLIVGIKRGPGRSNILARLVHWSYLSTTCTRTRARSRRSSLGLAGDGAGMCVAARRPYGRIATDTRMCLAVYIKNK